MENTTQGNMMDSMKKFPTGKLVIFGIILILAGWIIGAYNHLITLREANRKAFAEVQNQYTRQMDLIPNFVNTVQGYAKFEKSTLTDVINARANATKVVVNTNNLTPEAFAAFDASQNSLGASLGKLLAISESYPTLKANEQFMALATELEGTQNRITVARMRYNESVEEYNMFVQRFPGSALASVFNFTVEPYLQSKANADVPPVVNFN